MELQRQTMGPRAPGDRAVTRRFDSGRYRSFQGSTERESYESQGTLRIGARTIGEGAPVFVIAEIGVNHEGSVERAKAFVDAAVEAGADCVKFQMRSPPELFVNGGDPDDPSEDLGSQYILDILRQAQLEPEEMFEVFDYVLESGVESLCTPWEVT